MNNTVTPAIVSTSGYGAGVYATNVAARNCRFIGNQVLATSFLDSSAQGGGLCGNGTASDCIFQGNGAVANAPAIVSASGGAVHGSVQLTNCTIVGNEATATGEPTPAASGAGIDGAAGVQNCILWDNVLNGAMDQAAQVANTAAVNYSIVEGWTGTLGGNGNNGADPLFVNSPSDLHLQPGSPAIDAGNNMAVPADTADLDGDGDTTEPTPLDLDGNPRFVDDPSASDTGAGTPPIVDMGAYEFQPALTILSANPPASNPYGSGVFRDVLDTGTSAALTAGIGGAGTAPQGGIEYAQIGVTFNGTPSLAPTPGNVTIACTGGACPTVTGVSGAGSSYTISLSGVIPPVHCTTLTFAGTAPGQKLQYQFLPGDVGLDAVTDPQDLLALIQALNNGAANLASNLARYNVNRSTGTNPVNTQDLLRLVQLLNATNTTQAFNNATVAACP